MSVLPVTFRTQRAGPFKGTVNAVFPTLTWDYFGREMTCFTLEEGHGGCSFSWYRARTRPATADEAAPVLAKLRRIYRDDPLERPDVYGEPYELKPVRRISAAHRRELDVDARRAREALRRDPSGAPWSPGEFRHAS